MAVTAFKERNLLTGQARKNVDALRVAATC